MRKINKLILMVILGIAISSCKKEEVEPTTEIVYVEVEVEAEDKCGCGTIIKTDSDFIVHDSGYLESYYTYLYVDNCTKAHNSSTSSYEVYVGQNSCDF